MKRRQPNISIAAILAALSFINWTPPGDPILSASLTYNPILSPNIAPMYFPVSGGANPTINLVCPKEITLENIKIPSITLDGVKVPAVTISQINLKNTVTLSEKFYQQYGKFVGISDAQIKAGHNFAIAKIQSGIATGLIGKTCKVTAQITVEAAQNYIKRKHPVISEKVAKIASKIPGKIAETIAKKTTTEWVTDGCTVTLKFLGKNILEIGIDAKFGLDNQIEEFKYLMGYMNSVPGMTYIFTHLK